MSETMLHEKETPDESQQHLNANADKFNGDLAIVYNMLKSGVRLTGRILETDYGIDSRRLRDIFAARPDVVKKHWIKSEDGTTRYVEYYVEIPRPTKKYLQQNLFDVCQ